MSRVVKTVFILLTSPNYIQVIELRFGLIAEVKLSSKMTLTWAKDAHPSCWYHLGSPHRYNVTSVFDFGPQFSCHSYKWEVIKADQLSPGSFCFSVGWQGQVFLRVVVSKPNSKISNPSSVEFAWEPREDTGNSILLEHIPRGKNS